MVSCIAGPLWNMILIVASLLLLFADTTAAQSSVVDESIRAALGAATAAAAVEESNPVVSVRFYGESQCPYCRKFVEEAWPTVWNDAELMEHVDYDFIAWGNAYFATPKCSSQSDHSTYDPQERACWYKECIETSTDNPDECFSPDKVIYQHSVKEGQVDIYEMCVKMHYGLEAGVDFTYCCEGPNMDDPHLAGAQDLLLKCSTSSSSSDRNRNATQVLDPHLIHECYKTLGHSIEVQAAKATPSHPGVPYVLVDGEFVEDPFSIQKAICDKLKQKKKQQMEEPATDVMPFSLPKACTDESLADTMDSSSNGREGTAVPLAAQR